MLTLELPDITDAETLALAEAVKRFARVDADGLAADADEAERIWSAVAKLQRALAAAGYAPR